MSSAAALQTRMRESLHHDEFLAFSADPATRGVLVELARQHDWPAQTVQEGSVAAAIHQLVISPSPYRLVVDVSENPDPVNALQMLRDACTSETVIIAIGTVNDVKLYRDICQAGAADYVVKPVTRESLSEVIEKALRDHSRSAEGQPAEHRLGRLVLFVGTKGGIGTSTLAMNCAWLLAHEQETRVALVDLDLQFGTLALNLDLEPSHGLSEALANPSRVDSLFLTSAMVNQSKNLSVLASEVPLERPTDINPEATSMLFNTLRQSYACVVADLPRSILSLNREVVEKASHVFIVTDLSLPGVRDTLRLLSFMRDVAPGPKVDVVANHVRGGRGQISKAEFERGIETRLRFLIPDDPKVATVATNAGKPIAQIAKNSAMVRALRAVTKELAGPTEAAAKTRLWPTGLFRRGK